MDLTTVVGMLISWILVIGGMASGGSLGAYIDIPSLLITIGGTIGAIIISFPGNKPKNGYISIINGSAADGFVVTNTKEPEKTEVAGSKIGRAHV